MEVRLVIIGKVKQSGIGHVWFARSELVRKMGVDGLPTYSRRIIEEPLSLWKGYYSKEPIPIHYYIANDNGRSLTPVPDPDKLD
jgi:hypothetical protein